MVSEVLPDLLDGNGGAAARSRRRSAVSSSFPKLRIESVCDCGDENCSSFADPRARSRSHNHVELPAMEGMLIVDLKRGQRDLFHRGAESSRREVSDGRVLRRRPPTQLTLLAIRDKNSKVGLMLVGQTVFGASRRFRIVSRHSVSLR